MSHLSHLGALVARLASGAFVAAAAVVLAVGASGSAAARDWALATGPRCPLAAVVGLPCPFCGMTRATLALGAGDVDAALAFHPLAPVVLVATLAVAASIALRRDQWLRRPGTPGVVLTAVLAVWAIKLAA